MDHRIPEVSSRWTKAKIQGLSGTLFLTWDVRGTCPLFSSSSSAITLGRELPRTPPAVGEAQAGSSEPGCPHLSPGSGATAPRAPAAAAGLSLVPRRGGGVAVSGATRRGVAAGTGGGGRERGREGVRGCARRPAGLGRWESAWSSRRDPWAPTRAPAKGVRTFRRRGAHLPLYRPGRDVTAAAVGGGGRPHQKRLLPQNRTRMAGAPPPWSVESHGEEMEIKP